MKKLDDIDSESEEEMFETEEQKGEIEIIIKNYLNKLINPLNIVINTLVVLTNSCV